MAIINDWSYSNPFNTTSVTLPYIPKMHAPLPTGSQLIRVNGIESAKDYPTAPNSMIALFDENDDIMYIKQTDASNFPTIRKFRFVEEKEEKPEEVKYVTVEEFNKFKEEMLNAQQFVRKPDEPITPVVTYYESAPSEYPSAAQVNVRYDKNSR